MRTALRNARDVNLLFDDTFEGGRINPTLWTVTDTESKLSVAGGKLVCAGGMAVPAWGDPRAAAGGVVRSEGLAFEVEITPTAAGHGGILVHTSATFGAPTDGVIALYCDASGMFAIGADAAAVTYSAGPYTAGVTYRLRFIAKATGWLAYISGGIYGQLGMAYSLLWSSAASTASPLFLGYSVYNLPFASHFARVFRSIPKPPTVSDTFTRADSATTLGAAETGQAWTAVVGTWGIATNKAYIAVDGGVNVVTIEAGVADFILDADMTIALAAAWERSGLCFRFVNTSNYFRFGAFRTDVGATSWILEQIVAGVDSIIGQAVEAIPNATYALRVVAIGSAIKCYRNGVEKISVTDTDMLTATGVGLMSYAAAASLRFDNFTVQTGGAL